MKWIVVVGVLLDLVLGEELITCASVLKLANGQDKSRLHSHEVKYGSGSQQQSVTATNNHDDVNSHWQILGRKFSVFVDRCFRKWSALQTGLADKVRRLDPPPSRHHSVLPALA